MNNASPSIAAEVVCKLHQPCLAFAANATGLLYLRTREHPASHGMQNGRFAVGWLLHPFPTALLDSGLQRRNDAPVSNSGQGVGTKLFN